MDADIEMLFPDDYINNTSERLKLYTTLNGLSNESELDAFEKELIDRFGPIPDETKDLLLAVQVKWICNYMGMEKVVMKKGKFLGYFIANQQSDYYQSARFRKVLAFVQAHSKQCSLKEKQTRSGLRLLLVIEGVHKVNSAYKLLSNFTAS